MARPTRLDEASTRHVGFRLTEEEIEHLDQLVTKLGFSDRSALLRAWLDNDGPTKRKTLRAWKKPSESSSTTPQTNHRQTQRTKANTPRSSNPVAKVHVEPKSVRKQRPRATAPNPSHVDSRATQPKSIMRELLVELNRHRGEVLIQVADVVRALLPHASMETVHEALLTLDRNGLIELRPDGGTEFLKAEDVKVCPRGPRDTVFAYARFKDANAR